jgi:hypothetical protein
MNGKKPPFSSSFCFPCKHEWNEHELTIKKKNVSIYLPQSSEGNKREVYVIKENLCLDKLSEIKLVKLSFSISHLPLKVLELQSSTLDA